MRSQTRCRTCRAERIKALIASGAVRDTHGAAHTDPSARAVGGMAFDIDVPRPVPAAAEAQAIDLAVVFEDDHLIVIDKPAGLVVHPAAGNPDGTLVNALLHHCAGNLSGIGGVARPGIVHRIDKDTSGLIVAAKSDAAHLGLARQFKDHSIDRRYIAVVTGAVRTSAGTISASLARSSSNRKKIAVVEDGRGKPATTHWRKLSKLRDATIIECRLETGRTHQVRVHMASIGHALLGDPVYAKIGKAHRGLLETLGFRRQALHAAPAGVHPSGK